MTKTIEVTVRDLIAATEIELVQIDRVETDGGPILFLNFELPTDGDVMSLRLSLPDTEEVRARFGIDESVEINRVESVG